MIAVSLSCRPKLLLADEPTTALDATVQIQVLVLLRKLQRELGMAMIFVTHDLGVAAQIADKVAVMYAGRIVEYGSVDEVLLNPSHPYTPRHARIDGAWPGARDRHRRHPRQPAGSAGSKSRAAASHRAAAMPCRPAPSSSLLIHRWRHAIRPPASVLVISRSRWRWLSPEPP